MSNLRIAERGGGSYRLLALQRWVMVLIFICFGIQKFTPQSAHGIAPYISHNPFVGWLQVFGLRGEAYLLGVIELATAAILAGGAFSRLLPALGAAALSPRVHPRPGPQGGKGRRSESTPIPKKPGSLPTRG